MGRDDTVVDETDRAILYHLQADARHNTNSDISDRTDVSATTVGTRIGELEDTDVVETYDAVVDYEKAGFPHRIVLFATAPTGSRDRHARELLDVRGVVHVDELLSGRENLLVEVVGRTRDDLAETIAAAEELSVEVTRSEIVKDRHSDPFDGFAPDREGGTG